MTAIKRKSLLCFKGVGPGRSNTPKSRSPALIALNGFLNKINEDTNLGALRMEDGSGGAGEGG